MRRLNNRFATSFLSQGKGWGWGEPSRTLCLMLCFVLFFTNCKQANSPTVSAYRTLTGKTMGTTYMVKYSDHFATDYQAEIDVLLKEVNQYLSTYIPDSYISLFNKDKTGVQLPNSATGHFSRVFNSAKFIYQKTNGAFEPTVMPLVNYWGFGYTEKKAVTSADEEKISQLMQSIGFDKVNRDGGQYSKKHPDTQLDFSAIAKGYGVDVIAELLDSKGIQNYVVEIGGEVRAKGKNDRNAWWLTAINTPDSKAKLNDFKAKVSLKNNALATSGNYRNFYEVDGKKYAHTINPKTGYPEKNTLLSASIFAKDCMTADAYATACMVMGLDKAYKLISADSDLEGYFIYSDDKGEMQIKQTSGMGQFLYRNH